MHLLDTTTLRLSEYIGENLPRYAILSHTWEKEEITFQDVSDLTKASAKAGWAKVTWSAAVAKSLGYQYIWIDTCCIDKRSSAELTEAINSMYRWYKMADCCLVYLADVHWTGEEDPSLAEANIDPSSASHKYEAPFDQFERSRWWSRSWTLQELIAPANLVFFSSTWKRLGSKTQLLELVRIVSGVDGFALAGGDLMDISVARKMSWAAEREATRVEDVAYSLMGLFDVNMPLLYGEGTKAFFRLQREILSQTQDDSIFAWAATWPGYLERHVGLLAESPEGFWKAGVEGALFRNAHASLRKGPVVVTGQEVQIELMVRKSSRIQEVALDCQWGRADTGFPSLKVVACSAGLISAISDDRLINSRRHGEPITNKMACGHTPYSVLTGKNCSNPGHKEWELRRFNIPHRAIGKPRPIFQVVLEGGASIEAVHQSSMWDRAMNRIYGMEPGIKMYCSGNIHLTRAALLFKVDKVDCSGPSRLLVCVFQHGNGVMWCSAHWFLDNFEFLGDRALSTYLSQYHYGHAWMDSGGFKSFPLSVEKFFQTKIAIVMADGRSVVVSVKNTALDRYDLKVEVPQRRDDE